MIIYFILVSILQLFINYHTIAMSSKSLLFPDYDYDPFFPLPWLIFKD